MKKTSLFLAGLLLPTFSASAATTITTAAGIGADTYLQENAADTVNGTANNFVVKHQNTANNRMGVLRFDLGMSFSTQSNISGTSISLTLANAPQNYTYSLYGLNDITAPDSRTLTGGNGWIESGTSGVTWNTSQGLRTGENPSASFTLLGTFTFITPAATDGTTITIGNSSSGVINGTGLAAAMDAFMQADTNGAVSFAVYRTADAGAASTTNFYTKENLAGVGGVNNPAFNPTLTFVPEPSSALMTGLAGLALLVRRRRA